MSASSDSTRRAFLQTVVGVSGGLALLGSAAPGRARVEEATPGKTGKASEPEGEISPTEDVMREHGVLKRLLLVYEEAIRRLDRQADLPPDAVADAASRIRSCIEDYREKLEEEFLFPRFHEANKLVDLVEAFLAQHRAGRAVTETTLHLATLQAFKRVADRRTLTHALRSFIRMYNPHEAREDTVLFLAFRTIVTPHEDVALGETLEQREHQRFGEDGFEQIVDRVAAIEKHLAIDELAQFTPRR